MTATSKSTAKGEEGEGAPGIRLDLRVQLSRAAGQAGDDAGEDEQAHAVANATVGNLLAQPHDEGGAGGEREDRHQAEADARIQHHATLLQDGSDADRLQGAQDDRHVTGPLGDLAPAQLAFLLNARQGFIDHGEQLEDDRRRNVRHDAQREDGHLAQVAAAEQVHQPQGRSALRAEELFQQFAVYARGRNVRAQPIDGEDEEGEQNPLAQVGNPEDIEKLLKHSWLSASGRLPPLESCH